MIESGAHGPKTVTVKAPMVPGTYYYGCPVSDHCSRDGQKITVRVA